jgi:hypothetical protein
VDVPLGAGVGVGVSGGVGIDVGGPGYPDSVGVGGIWGVSVDIPTGVDAGICVVGVGPDPRTTGRDTSPTIAAGVGDTFDPDGTDLTT